MKDLSTLVEDVYHLYDPDIDHVVNEDNLKQLTDNIAELFRRRLRAQPADEFRPIRFSGLGKPNRQVWYDAHPIDGGKEKLNGQTLLKFNYGDLIEQMLLFLVKEAGHEVTGEQDSVAIDDISGSIDAIIDNVVVDVKSASPYGYAKFRDKKILDEGNDPFFYVNQLAGYASVLTPGKDAAWLAMDKVSGEICVTPLSAGAIAYHPPEKEIARLKEAIALPEPPALCYQPEADGKSGNLKLPTPCSYCSHKHRCHPALRTFLYSSGPRFLTHVAKVPDVPEVV